MSATDKELLKGWSDKVTTSVPKPATMSIKIRPFMVPSTVTLEMPETKPNDLMTREMKPNVEIQLQDLDLETLEHLCAEFRTNVLNCAKIQASTKTL